MKGLRHVGSTERWEPSHFVALDFEATCAADGRLHPQEIIEFPSVLLDADLQQIDTFESFVRPVRHPRLTRFCTELTSITQVEAEGAETFPRVLARYLDWLVGHGLATSGKVSYVLVTCGSWDLGRMFPMQLRVSGLSHLPAPFREWLDIRLPFEQCVPEARGVGLLGMLDALGLPHVGRHHRGIDDAHALVAILRELRRRGVSLAATHVLPGSHHPPLGLLIERDGRRCRVNLRRRRIQSLLGVATQACGRRANRAFCDGRPLRRDEDLFDLEADTVVQVY
jgi:ERI1 exoribonuclease 3